MSVLMRIDVAATPAIVSGHGRSSAAWKNPVIAKMKNSGFLDISSGREDEQADEVDEHPARCCSRRGSGARVNIA